MANSSCSGTTSAQLLAQLTSWSFNSSLVDICTSVCVFAEIFRGSECLWPDTRRKSWPAFSRWGTTSTTSPRLNPCNRTAERRSMKYSTSVQSERGGCRLFCFTHLNFPCFSQSLWLFMCLCGVSGSLLRSLDRRPHIGVNYLWLKIKRKKKNKKTKTIPGSNHKPSFTLSPEICLRDKLPSVKSTNLFLPAWLFDSRTTWPSFYVRINHTNTLLWRGSWLLYEGTETGAGVSGDSTRLLLLSPVSLTTSSELVKIATI